ncbi:MAG: T9SS type A sorting domain-containing protein, partial [Flavisolibacter sp.]
QDLHDLDAKEYIYKANITIPEEKIAISKLFRALKYYGIWDDIHALYLPCGGTELSHSLNAKDPRLVNDAYPLVFPNGATHKHSGISWNGIDQGARSSYRPTSSRLHLMVYHKTEASQPAIFSGALDGQTDMHAYSWSALFSNGLIGFSNTNNYDWAEQEQRTGFFYGQRISHQFTEGYVNGIKIATWQKDLGSYYNTDTSEYIWLNKSNQFAQFLDTVEYQLVSIGNAMNAQKVENFYKITQAFLSELNIQAGEAIAWPIVPQNYYTTATSNFEWIKATGQAVDTAIDGVHLYNIGDSLYLWGGWNGNWFPFSFNTGHVSGDGGYTWKPLGNAPWNIRHSAAAGTDDIGNSYIIGSDLMAMATETDRKEVWRTTNGRDWELRTNTAPWSGNLILHGLATKGDSLFVAGGQFEYSINGGFNDTIWRSTDGGANWNAINTYAPQLGGILYNNFKYFKARGKFIAFSGGHYHNTADQRTYSKEIWVSNDCITWTREKDVPFEARQYSDMVEWDEKLWVFAGDREALTGNGWINLKDLWYMDKKGDWHEAGSVPLPERHASGLTVDRKNNRLVIACGNMHQDVWLYNKLEEGPEFNAPLIKDIYNDNCHFSVPNLVNSLSTDHPGINFTQTPAAGTQLTVANNDLIEIQVTGAASYGNRTQSVTLRIHDTIAPLYSLPDTVIGYLNNASVIRIPYVIAYMSTQESCAGNSIIQSIPSGTIMAAQHNQIIPVQVEAKDIAGNTEIYTIYLQAKDTTRPLINCPPPQNIQMSIGCKINIPDMTGSVVASDNSSQFTLTQSPEPGTIIPTLPNVSHALIIKATDAAGNFKTCTVQVTGIDTTSPGFEPVINKQFFTDAGKCYSSMVVSMPAVADNCNVTVTRQRSDGMPAGSSFKVGETTIMWLAEDLAGNEAYVEQKIIVIDNQAPLIETLQDRSFCTKQNNMYTLPSLVSKDNCGIASTSYTITGATNRSGNSSNASGSFNPGENYINWKVTDINGNVSTSQTRITVNSALSVSVPDVYTSPVGTQPNTIYLGFGSASLTLQAQVIGGQAPFSYSWSNGSNKNSLIVTPSFGGVHHYSVTVTDALGCMATINVMVKVIDVRCDNSKILVCKNEPVTQATLCVTRQEAENLLTQGYGLGPCSTPVMQDSLMYFSVRVKPNPSPTHFTLNIHHIYKDPLIISIYDMTGRLIETIRLHTQQIEIALGHHYRPGVYIAEVSCGRYKKQLKLVKTGN